MGQVRDIYRRHYANYIFGKRINRLSLEAEAWFWRVHDTADDYGNNHADEFHCHAATVGRRLEEVTPKQVSRFVEEMEKEKLVQFYEADGLKYLHVVGWLQKQPKAANGKRVHRFPPSPWDSEDLDLIPEDADGGIRGNPSESSYSHSHSHSHSQFSSEASIDAPEPLLSFPVVGRGSKTWPFTEECLAELSSAFPSLDVLAESRKALAWCQANPGRRKTERGMKKFLFGWMERTQNRGGGVNQQPSVSTMKAGARKI